jgi:hypothetical protein
MAILHEIEAATLGGAVRVAKENPNMSNRAIALFHLTKFSPKQQSTSVPRPFQGLVDF